MACLRAFGPGHTTGVTTSNTRAVRTRAAREGRRHEPKAAIAGLTARGVLYLVLALTAVQLTIGRSSERVNSRGALQQFGGSTLGSVMLVVLALGFIGFVLLNVFDAITAGARDDQHPKRRLADVVRAAIYAGLTFATISILVSGSSGSSSSTKSKTWTATVLGWSGGRLLVGAAGLAVIAAGLVVIVKVVIGKPHDQASIEEAAPNEPGAVQMLGAVGNAARGAVMAIIGGFVLIAAVNYDPSETVGLDGALKRALDEQYGTALVLAIAVGFAAYGIYSLARAWVNRAIAQT